MRKQGTTMFFHDLLEFVHEKLLRMRPDMRATCDEIVAKFTEMRKRCEHDREYCTKIVPRSDRTATNNSELLSSYAGMATIPEAGPPDEDVESQADIPESSRTSSEIKDITRIIEGRQFSQSPTPRDSSPEVHKVTSKSNLKRIPGYDLAGAGGEAMIPPSPRWRQPSRTNSNETGESSPNKRVSFADKTDVHSYHPQSPDNSQPAGGDEDFADAPEGKQDGTGISENPESMPHDRLPSPATEGCLSSPREHGSRHPIKTAVERPAPIEAQKVLSHERSGSLNQERAACQPGPGCLALPPQQLTSRSSTNGEQKPTSNERPPNGPDLEQATTKQLLVLFCKRLWCFNPGGQ